MNTKINETNYLLANCQIEDLVFHRDFAVTYCLN